jgi:hypothetical protein
MVGFVARHEVTADQRRGPDFLGWRFLQFSRYCNSLNRHDRKAPAGSSRCPQPGMRTKRSWVAHLWKVLEAQVMTYEFHHAFRIARAGATAGRCPLSLRPSRGCRNDAFPNGKVRGLPILEQHPMPALWIRGHRHDQVWTQTSPRWNCGGRFTLASPSLRACSSSPVWIQEFESSACSCFGQDFGIYPECSAPPPFDVGCSSWDGRLRSRSIVLNRRGKADRSRHAQTSSLKRRRESPPYERDPPDIRASLHIVDDLSPGDCARDHRQAVDGEIAAQHVFRRLA